MEKTKYTEYSEQLSTGNIVVQVPDEEEKPIQLVLNLGKTLLMSLDEFKEVEDAVWEALKQSGRVIESIET